MDHCLDVSHCPESTTCSHVQLQQRLLSFFEQDFADGFYAGFARYKRVLTGNLARDHWPEIFSRLETLFRCGKSVALNGPMVGVSMGIRDTDYFRRTASLLGLQRSHVASIEWMSTAWNLTFASSGLWMGKTFEPVAEDVAAQKCNRNPLGMDGFDPETTRLGRNFFRLPPEPAAGVQLLGLPALTALWNLRDRPLHVNAEGFDSKLLAANLELETRIPFDKTGGIFLANNGRSVLPEMAGKKVYQLNYRWPGLHPVYPMTRLIDEIVQLGEGVFLGQLIYASRHFSLGTVKNLLSPDEGSQLGEEYAPDAEKDSVYYGYQNNGYFLMLDPRYAEKIFAENAFFEIRPRPGELGHDGAASGVSGGERKSAGHPGSSAQWWRDGWYGDERLRRKFTTFITEPSPRDDDDDGGGERRNGESVLQMVQDISLEISRQTRWEDQIDHFEKLNRLFRRGVAPRIDNGLFTGSGAPGFNHRIDAAPVSWYGKMEPSTGIDFYHGANLNLHLGFIDSLRQSSRATGEPDDFLLFPDSLCDILTAKEQDLPNILNRTWHSIGKYIFPWAGKSFQTISGRKLSMLLDESPDLAGRYPARVSELQATLASRPHYELIRKNLTGCWTEPGLYAAQLRSGSWDGGMSAEDRLFWDNLAHDHWLFGANIMDERILAIDPLMKAVDINYHFPAPEVQAAALEGPSPFYRQGYIFLGADDRDSILPMNSGSNRKKKVFQFHYRFPMIGGPAPIGFCLDEIVEIADGLFLGQLIYATALAKGFHSSIAAEEYRYQLFGYFLLLDDDWQRHRLAIGLDMWRK